MTFETLPMTFTVSLPREMAEQVVTIEAEDPTYFERAIRYAITKRRLNVRRVPSDIPPGEEEPEV